MSKRSIINKSTVILIIALFIGGAAEASAYYYFDYSIVNANSPSGGNNVTPAPTQGPTPSPTPRPALFQVTNLTIAPFETAEGLPVNVTVAVSNLGDLEGSLNLNLTINNAQSDEKTVTLAGNETQIVAFTTTAGTEGTYNVVVGDLSGTFSVKSQPPPPLPTGLKVSNIIVDPLEAWANDPVTITFDATNGGTTDINGYPLSINVNGQAATKVNVTLAAGAVKSLNATVTANSTGKYTVSIIGYSAAPFNIVPNGKHTFHYIANRPDFPFTLDGNSLKSMYNALIDVGPHTLAAPATVLMPVPGWGNVVFNFNSWEDGTTNPSRTFDFQKEKYFVAYYIRPGSCPSLYVWNGTDYNYEAEVSDGPGWLGFVDHFNPDGSIKFSYNYPWDYVKITNNVLQPRNGFFDLKIMETADEIYYLDSVKLVAVDHYPDVDVFSTASTYLYNLTGQGTIYTISKNLKSPISAVDNTGQSVLPQISKLDGVSTTGARWQWNSLTLNLGNLAGSKEIKLLVVGTVNWPTTQQGGINFMEFANQPGVTPSPPPYMEVKAPNGSWIRVPDNRQFPLPDVTPEAFVVNLTGLFPTNDYSLRINTYQNITFDFIGVDTSTEQNINIQTILPTSADLQQAFWSGSNSTGNFTRYGDVTELVQVADDKFVIGREGDGVALMFPDNLTPVPEGMVRDYFVIASVWFKGKGLPYMSFTVDPLPFQAMTSFPYPANETYPYDPQHIQYLSKYNTRTVTTPTYLP